ncbi:MAG TPA: periplasmic heavy metal sensor [Pseudolabrys sp.]|nr:periplasmic heavy metal sensor [Pseudolabrys sp.]
MTRAIIILGAVLFLAAGSLQAQNTQPYAGMQARPLKALSDEQLADLTAGRGMGLALAAELNGYPGPKHVLELATRLNLTEAQRQRTQQLYDAMTAEAIPLGQQLIAAETELDRQFSRRTITPASLASATATIGAAQGRLRATHLKYHLSMMDVLTPEQVRRYGELRGYGGVPSNEHAPAMRHHMQ